jgi:hypothetical protein
MTKIELSFYGGNNSQHKKNFYEYPNRGLNPALPTQYRESCHRANAPMVKWVLISYFKTGCAKNLFFTHHNRL